MRTGALAVLVFAGCAPSTAAPPRLAGPTLAEGFWSHWGDGKAEVSGFALTQPRYGENRTGEAILVFVTEDFDEDARVKSDRGGAGTVPVLKLNEARDFQTGLYDYNAMTSTFVPLAGGLPACSSGWAPISPRTPLLPPGRTEGSLKGGVWFM